MLNRIFGLRCPDCGKKIDDDERYCPHCGADLDAPVEQVLDKEKSKEYLEQAQRKYDLGRNLKSALRKCNSSIQYDPTSPEAHNLRGLILDALGQTEAAIVSYQEALYLDPNFEDAKANLEDAQSDFQTTSVSKPDSQNNLWLKIVFGVTGISIILCASITAMFLYKFVFPYFEPKTQLVLEPDYSLISTVEPSDLETTAQILTERSADLGYRNISFVVSENNQIIGQIPGNIDIQKFTKRIAAIGLVEFVDFGKKYFSEGTFVATDYDYPYLSQPNTTIWHTIMTNNELQAVAVNKNQFGSYEIDFSLTTTGTKIFLNYTTENIGSYLGIVLDKRVISAPSINAPITGGSAQITGNFTEETAENLATYLKMKKPLPIPLKVQQPPDNNGNQ